MHEGLQGRLLLAVRTGRALSARAKSATGRVSAAQVKHDGAAGHPPQRADRKAAIAASKIPLAAQSYLWNTVGRRRWLEECALADTDG